jgi:hypothetical protein
MQAESGQFMSGDSHAITCFLLKWRWGNKDAADRLPKLVCRELHRMAARGPSG